MLYELSHFVKTHLGFVWEGVEWMNAVVFHLQHKNAKQVISSILQKHSVRFTIERVDLQDIPALAEFFASQPKSAYEFFHPHDFDAATLTKLVKRKSFLMFIIKEKDDIVGYFFLRCFMNGNSFKGRIVDYPHRNQGIAKVMGTVINDIVLALNLKLFTTISPDNYASLASTKAVNDIRIVRTLENGFYYIECTPKPVNTTDIVRNGEGG